MISIESKRIDVRMNYDPDLGGGSITRSVYKVWNSGHPLLIAYGINEWDAVTELLNRYGEVDEDD